MSQQDEIRILCDEFIKKMEERMLQKSDQNIGWKHYFYIEGVYVEMCRKLAALIESDGQHEKAKTDLIDIANYAMMWHDILSEDN